MSCCPRMQQAEHIKRARLCAYSCPLDQICRYRPDARDVGPGFIFTTTNSGQQLFIFTASPFSHASLDTRQGPQRCHSQNHVHTGPPFTPGRKKAGDQIGADKLMDVRVPSVREGRALLAHFDDLVSKCRSWPGAEKLKDKEGKE